ncbi:hypothetical protein [Tissierella sp.]|uniref:hypothetical protein n=1 Tax=Tissierella sp. TaxID=41274 RepID=UPI002856CE3C|nr:hypothetical protein [Tissierella sp.]MDR7855698.1 hypothetical protein [Tissierella sp.]
MVFELEGVTKSHIEDDAWLIFSLQIVSDKNIHGSIRFLLNTTGPGMASENDGSLGDDRYFPYDTTKQFEGWK